jgi:uridine kinase
MKKLNINFKDKIYQIDPLRTTMEFISEHNLQVKDPIAVNINGRFTRLSKKIRVDSTIEIIELATPQGKRIYESSVLFLFMAAFTKEFPKKNVFIQHSIHKGIYAEVTGGELEAEDVTKIEKRMREYVKRDLPITRTAKDWDVALEEMEENNRNDIINLYRYHHPATLKVYELDGFEEFLYLPLAPSAGILGFFKIEKFRDGVVIVLPDFEKSKDSPEFIDRPKLFKTYQEYHQWCRILKIRTVGHLNELIMNGPMGDMIKIAEGLHEKKIAQIADEITHKRSRPARLVLIAGPSSSGKTTFAKRLGIQLKVNGYHPVAISMDDYFVDREKTPKDAEGNYDFESIDAIDVALFKDHIAKLLKGEEVEIPKFDFITGTKGPSGHKMKLDSDQIIIIEGIHGINPKLTSSIDDEDKYKIYIAPLTQLNLHRHDRIAASETRLIRRIVRDSYFRGYSASDTLGRWKSVRTGEKNNIFPLQEEADVIFNSALFYELSVLKTHAERALLRVEKDDPMYIEAQRLLRFLSFFLPLDCTNDIPNNSILKEFIGGSAFKY